MVCKCPGLRRPNVYVLFKLIRTSLRQPENVRGSGDRMGWDGEVAMDGGSRMAHENPRPARTPSREQLSLFCFVFYETIPVDYIRRCFLLCRCVVYLSRGTTPHNSQGRGSALCTSSDSPGDVGITVDYYVYGVFY